MAVYRCHHGGSRYLALREQGALKKRAYKATPKTLYLKSYQLKSYY